MEFYKHQKTFGLEKYFIELEEWLNKPLNSARDNLPLVIEAEEGIGKKTLLVKWIEHHRNATTQVLVFCNCEI
jgi:transcriptional regulator of acetoin/glycerol metabolism